MDFRVSVCRRLFGEKIVMRLLDKGNLQLDMTKLGFEQRPSTTSRRPSTSPTAWCSSPGPTGSGKTTTLYSALSELNTIDRNISHRRRPRRVQPPGINQVQMHDDIGLNFAAALRSFLRQDPNIIMVGEIRDFETAEIAVKAALTGHLVLSTLHTNDAPSTIIRLLNMGVEPFLVTASVNLVLAQRLARRDLRRLQGPAEKHHEALQKLGMTDEQIRKAHDHEGPRLQGTCNNTGYKGRVALYEVPAHGRDPEDPRGRDHPRGDPADDRRGLSAFG
jgi:type IV pilus assembly protein PilB